MISGVTFSVRIWIKHHEIMDPCCLVSTVQTAGDGVILGYFLGTIGVHLFTWHSIPEYSCCPSLYHLSETIT